MMMQGRTPASPTPGAPFSPEESFALALDSRDPLAPFRDRFLFPEREDGKPVLYLCGNSLGLQPKAARRLVEEELDDWARFAVGAHFKARRPWFPYHELLRDPAARLIGALPREVVMMNSLTVNLHLMMVTFYRPTPVRHKVLMENPAFPSDTYAVKSQIRYHGYDPAEALLLAKPARGEHAIATESIESLLDERGEEIALVMLGAVNYFTGQAFDLPRIAAAARRRGCVVGFDLAHAIGNVPMNLHDSEVDFAVWCSYKYLDGGPGAVGGCFVHDRHGRDPSLPRFAGWWGDDPATRFRMHAGAEFVPVTGADGWQVSNPPILAMAPLKAALEIFDEAGMEALRAKSVALTGYLEYLVRRIPGGRFEVITPVDAAARGCQLSIRAREQAMETLRALEAEGVVADLREPDVIRVAPVPLYNRYHEVWRFARILEAVAASLPARR